jgi:hypothetical protein
MNRYRRVAADRDRTIQASSEQSQSLARDDSFSGSEQTAAE